MAMEKSQIDVMPSSSSKENPDEQVIILYNNNLYTPIHVFYIILFFLNKCKYISI